MSMNNAYELYRESSVFTSTPEELTLMLYNGLVRFIMQAQRAIDEKDLEKAHTVIIKAQDILVHFQMTLDMGFEISESLALIYDYMYRRLVDANVKKDRDILEEVLGLAKELRDTWAQAMKVAKQQNKNHQPAANGE